MTAFVPKGSRIHCGIVYNREKPEGMKVTIGLEKSQMQPCKETSTLDMWWCVPIIPACQRLR